MSSNSTKKLGVFFFSLLTRANHEEPRVEIFFTPTQYVLKRIYNRASSCLISIASSHQTRLNHNIFTTPAEREKYADQQIVPSAEQCHNKTKGTTTMSDGDILADATEGICWHKNNYGKSKENGLDDCGVPEFLKVWIWATWPSNIAIRPHI